MSVPSSGDLVGWNAFKTLKDKYSGGRDQQLSGVIKDFLTYKQKSNQAASDYLNEMRAKLTRVEDMANNDAKKIWAVLTSVTLVEHLSNSVQTELTKKLVFSRMAEAETAGTPLSYDTVESIIENDNDVPTEAPKTAPDLAMGAFGKNQGGRGAGKYRFGYGKGKGGRGAGRWQGWQTPLWQAVE